MSRRRSAPALAHAIPAIAAITAGLAVGSCAGSAARGSTGAVPAVDESPPRGAADADSPRSGSTQGRTAQGKSMAPQLPDQGQLGPEILLPNPRSTDDVRSRVEPLAIHKRHVFDRLLETDPRRARDLVRDLENDVLLVREAKRFGIAIDAAKVAARVGGREKQLREQIARELGARATFEGYLQRQMGLSLDEYRRLSRLSFSRDLYRNYVVRYVALREDRVQVRFIEHSDRKLLEEIAPKVRAGADFATLAIRHTEDEGTRRDGGMLPPFGSGFDHPVARVAFALEPGEVSEVLELERDDKPRFYLVYCLRKVPGRDVPFATVKAEIEREIAAGPLSQFEIEVVYSRLRSTVETLKTSGDRR